MSFMAMLAARAHEQGRAQRTALLRHRAIANDPLCLVAWQLGAEPYTVGALAVGRQSKGFKLYVPGYPLDRDLLFAELTKCASEFCETFEGYVRGPSERIMHYGEELDVPQALPQIVVANAETIALIGRLGRRLAYLPIDGERPVDQVLPRMGKHFMWLADYAHQPGQQLVLSVTDLLRTHYATSMSLYETQSLAAMDAWIQPAHGQHGFNAAEVAERQSVGPNPAPDDGEKIYRLMNEFRTARNGNRGRARALLNTLSNLYRHMVDDTWSLLWKAIERERQIKQAPCVQRREREDRIHYAVHMKWMNGSAQGRVRTRMNARSAAVRLNEYERKHGLLLAEEATDDPLRMAPVLLAGKAIAGEVIACDPDRREFVNGKRCKRPSVTIRTSEPCMIPMGAELWWTESPDGREWVVSQVVMAQGATQVTLVLQTNRTQSAGIPRRGDRACFSELNTRDAYEVHLPSEIPWTHRPKVPPQNEGDLDFPVGGAEAA